MLRCFRASSLLITLHYGSIEATHILHLFSRYYNRHSSYSKNPCYNTYLSMSLSSFVAAYDALIQPCLQDLTMYLQITHYATHSIQCRNLAQSILEALHSPLSYPGILRPHAEDSETALFEACIQQLSSEVDSVVGEALECCLEAAVSEPFYIQSGI